MGEGVFSDQRISKQRCINSTCNTPRVERQYSPCSPYTSHTHWIYRTSASLSTGSGQQTCQPDAHTERRMGRRSDPLVISTDSPRAPWISAAVPQDMSYGGSERQEPKFCENGAVADNDQANDLGETKARGSGLVLSRVIRCRIATLPGPHRILTMGHCPKHCNICSVGTVGGNASNDCRINMTKRSGHAIR